MKFIKLQNKVINTDQVKEFHKHESSISIYYTDGSKACVSYKDAAEAEAALEDILHMIDSRYIPSWVREATDPTHCFDNKSLPQWLLDMEV